MLCIGMHCYDRAGYRFHARNVFYNDRNVVQTIYGMERGSEAQMYKQESYIFFAFMQFDF